MGGAGSRDSFLASIACEENMTRVTPRGGRAVTGGPGWLASTGHGHLGGGEMEMNMGTGERAGRETERELLSQAFYLNLLNSWKIIMLNTFCLPVIVTWSRLCSASLSHAHMRFSFLYLKDSIIGGHIHLFNQPKVSSVTLIFQHTRGKDFNSLHFFFL